MNPLRIGVVGAGANTRSRHLPGLQALDGVKVISVCNRSRHSSEQVAAEFGIPTVYEDWQALVAADDTDAIVIGTWPYLHCPVTLAALEAGKHVMCEARMAMNLDEALAMQAAARAHPDLVTQVVPSPFTLHVDRTIQRMISEGFLGEPIAVEMYLPGDGFADTEAPITWRQDTALSGANIMGLGIWYEALMRWLGTASHVYAHAKTVVAARPNPQTGRQQPVTVPDHIDVVGELGCGAQLHILMSTVIGHAGTPVVHLFGTEGTLCFRENRLWAGSRTDQAPVAVEIPEHETDGWRVEDEFVGAIRGTESIRLTTFDDGVRYMAFTEAVQESITRRSEVAVQN